VDVPAHAFAASLLARHRRARATWSPPASTIWRRAPAPIALRAHVRVVAPVTHLLRMVTRTAGEGAVAHTGPDAPVVPRLEARRARIESVIVPRRPGGEPPAAAPHAAARPVTRVLARPAPTPVAWTDARPAPVVAAPATPRWPAAAHRRDDDGTIGLERLDVARLTDRVVDAIDRRLLAQRERIRR
jgi:hypothetical protein